MSLKTSLNPLSCLLLALPKLPEIQGGLTKLIAHVLVLVDKHTSVKFTLQVSGTDNRGLEGRRILEGVLVQGISQLLNILSVVSVVCLNQG